MFLSHAYKTVKLAPFVEVKQNLIENKRNTGIQGQCVP